MYTRARPHVDQPVRPRIVSAEEAAAEVGLVYREPSRDFTLARERVLHFTPYENKVFRFLLSSAPGRATMTNLHLALYGGQERALNAAAVMMCRVKSLILPFGLSIGKSGHKGYRFITGPSTLYWLKAPVNSHLKCELCGQELKGD